MQLLLQLLFPHWYLMKVCARAIVHDTAMNNSKIKRKNESFQAMRYGHSYLSLVRATQNL